MHPLLNIAVRAARRAGEVIVRSLVRLESLEVSSKGRNDYVSEIDRTAERDIIDIIHKHYPEHAILAEESGGSGDNDTVWIIDPLDGTTNFLHGFPVFAVSIAVQCAAGSRSASSTIPMRQEVFSAARGEGAHLENHRIRVSKQRGLEGALLATGFPYREDGALRGQLFRDVSHADDHDRGHSPPGFGGAGSGLCRLRSRRWFLGDGPEGLGHGRRHADDTRGRRARRYARWR